MPLALRSVAAALVLLAVAVPASAQAVECIDGQAAGYDCDRIDLLAFLSPQALGAPAFGQCPNPYPQLCANDIWGWADPETGRRYAIIGLPNGTAFVDLTNPVAPVRLGMLPTETNASSWRDVKAIRNVAVIVSEAGGHGMQVFDLTRLRELGEDAARRFTADVVYHGFGSAHNVVVNEETGFAYAVGSRVADSTLPPSCTPRGLHAVDLSNPLAPTFGGCFSDAALENGPRAAGYTHDAQCIVYDGPDRDHTGREICFAANEDVVTIFDATDKDNVEILSQVGYPSPAYTHQGWLTEDRRYFLTNDELDEAVAVNSGDVAPQRTLVIDVSDLDAPEFSFEYRSGLSTIDHNLYVVGNLAFESNYEAGLRVIDLSGIDNGALEEVAFFDTYSVGTSVNFAGQWSNYPFFGDGLIIVNDGETGFFVFQLDRDLVAATSASPRPAAAFSLSEPVPNPTASGARLALQVDVAQSVRAELFDVAGRRVADVFDGPVRAGAELTLTVATGALPAGVYVLRVQGERFEAARRLVVSR